MKIDYDSDSDVLFLQLEGESTAAVFAQFCWVAASAVDTMSQNENMYEDETEEQRTMRNKKEEEECLQMLIEANRENDFLIEVKAAARKRAAMEEAERQQRLQDLRQIENDVEKLRKRKLLDHGVKQGWWELSEKEKKRRKDKEWWEVKSEDEEEDDEESLSRIDFIAKVCALDPQVMLHNLLAQKAQKRRSEAAIHERAQKIKKYKEERWYRLFLTAKGMDETLVSPSEPDPSDFSMKKYTWTKALLKWKADTIALVERLNSMPLYAPGLLPS